MAVTRAASAGGWRRKFGVRLTVRALALLVLVVAVWLASIERGREGRG